MSSKLHIVAITAFIKNKAGDKFLVLKRHENEIAYPGKWAFAGGKVERGQTVLETLKREVKEEAGLDIADLYTFLKDFTFIRPDDKNVVGFCFLVTALSEDVSISEDFSEYKWVTPQEFLALDSIPGMEEEVKIAFKH